MRNFLGGAVAIIVLAEVAGCGSYLSSSASQALVAIKVGMARDEVVKQIGEPHSQEIFGNTELLTYQSDWTLKDAAAGSSPIVIAGGKVVGLGPTYALRVKQEHRSANASLK